MFNVEFFINTYHKVLSILEPSNITNIEIGFYTKEHNLKNCIYLVFWHMFCLSSKSEYKVCLQNKNALYSHCQIWWCHK